MNLTPFVGAQVSTGTPRLQRFLNVSVTPPGGIGTATGTAAAFADGLMHVNGFCRLAGAILWAVKDAILRSVDDGVTWETVYTITPAVFGYGWITGPYVVYKAGVPRLVVIYRETPGGTIRYIWSDTGLSGSWTNVATGLSPSPRLGPATVVWNSQITFQTDNTNLRFLDPFTGAISTLNPGSGQIEYLWVWNNLIHASIGSGGGSEFVNRIVGGVATNLATIVLGSNKTANTAAAWVDPATGNSILVMHTTGGWRSFTITAAGAVTETTANMVTPSTLAAYTTNPRTKGVVYDQQQAPGGAPQIYLLAGNAGNLAGNLVGLFRFNGFASALGQNTGSPWLDAGPNGTPNDVGGDTAFQWVDKNVGGERFFTPRSPGFDGSPEAYLTNRGTILLNATRRFFRAYRPRSVILSTAGGAINLNAAPLGNVPIQARSVTLVGVIAAVSTRVQDDGAGNFPVSALLPAGGTIDYATGAMTGVTAALDAGQNLEALYTGGTVTVRVYRTLASDEYPASTTRANLSDPTNGAIGGGNENTGVPADGTECAVTVDMTGFGAGDRFSMTVEAV